MRSRVPTLGAIIATLLFFISSGVATGATPPPAAGSGTPTVGVRPVEWGVTLHPEDAGYDVANARLELGIIRKLGCGFVRTDFCWSDLEPARDQWDGGKLRFYSDFLDAARSMGLQVQVLLSRAPDWAKTLYGVDPDGFFEEYRQYCAEVARRFGSRVHYYQIWNEADNFLDFVPFWDDWRLFKSGHAGLEKYDRDFETYVNTTSLPWTEWELNDWLRRAGDAIDIIGVDYYPGTWTITPYDDWSPLQRVLEKISDPNDPAFGKKAAIQETGFSTFLCFWHNEFDQKNWINTSLPALREIIRSHNARYANKVVSCCWYELLDTDTSGGWWLENHFGILRSDWSKKPGFGDLRARIAEFKR
jgi:hypothetical protein